MALTVQIKPEIEAELAAQAAALGLDVSAYAAAVLEQAVVQPAAAFRHKSPKEIRAWLDSMAEFSDQIPPTPGETFPRDMIYQDHD